mmetsp:Transcript_455/g.1200  ORF Transcript_455/g.1200 Transcript_455/m.1200 type:complete len:344 (+) Transcript_455:31-1062(+)
MEATAETPEKAPSPSAFEDIHGAPAGAGSQQPWRQGGAAAEAVVGLEGGDFAVLDPAVPVRVPDGVEVAGVAARGVDRAVGPDGRNRPGLRPAAKVVAAVGEGALEPRRQLLLLAGGGPEVPGLLLPVPELGAGLGVEREEVVGRAGDLQEPPQPAPPQYQAGDQKPEPQRPKLLADGYLRLPRVHARAHEDGRARAWSINETHSRVLLAAGPWQQPSCPQDLAIVDPVGHDQAVTKEARAQITRGDGPAGRARRGRGLERAHREEEPAVRRERAPARAVPAPRLLEARLPDDLAVARVQPVGARGGRGKKQRAVSREGRHEVQDLCVTALVRQQSLPEKFPI